MPVPFVAALARWYGARVSRKLDQIPGPGGALSFLPSDLRLQIVCGLDIVFLPLKAQDVVRQPSNELRQACFAANTVFNRASHDHAVYTKRKRVWAKRVHDLVPCRGEL